MRLIDADYALKILTEDWFLEIILTTWGKSDAKEEIENALNRVETAYDVEAVVAELEKQAKQYHRRAEEHKGYDAYNNLFEGKALSYEHAISIVRGKE